MARDAMAMDQAGSPVVQIFCNKVGEAGRESGESCGRLTFEAKGETAFVVGKLAKKMGSTRAPSSPQASLDDGPRRFGLGEAVRLNPHPARRALLDSQGEAAYRSPRR